MISFHARSQFRYTDKQMRLSFASINSWLHVYIQGPQAEDAKDKNIDGQTVRRIVREDLDRPARVTPVKACLTEAMKSGRVEWVNSKLRWKTSEWQGVFYLAKNDCSI